MIHFPTAISHKEAQGTKLNCLPLARSQCGAGSAADSESRVSVSPGTTGRVSCLRIASYLYSVPYMKQILIEVDDETARRLEKVAPARSRQRSGFIRGAIARALSDLEEQKTREAYGRQPDSCDDSYFDPRVWEPRAAYDRRGKKRR